MITLKKIFRALKKISKWATPTTERIYEIWTERRNGGEKNMERLARMERTDSNRNRLKEE